MVLGAAAPGHDKVRAYQSMLWTTPPEQADDFFHSSGDSVSGLADWDRWRFGFPIQSVTLDRSGTVTQLRMEWRFLILNAVVGCAAGCLLLVIARALKPRPVLPPG